MMARTHTISMSVKPLSPPRSLGPVGDVGCCTGSSFLAVGTVGDDVVGSALARGSVHVRFPPRILGYCIALKIRSIPGRRAARAFHKCGQAFRARWILPGIE